MSYRHCSLICDTIACLIIFAYPATIILICVCFSDLTIFICTLYLVSFNDSLLRSLLLTSCLLTGPCVTRAITWPHYRRRRSQKRYQDKIRNLQYTHLLNNFCSTSPPILTPQTRQFSYLCQLHPQASARRW